MTFELTVILSLGELKLKQVKGRTNVTSEDEDEGSQKGTKGPDMHRWDVKGCK